jgi:hypothetical protein
MRTLGNEESRHQRERERTLGNEESRHQRERERERE